MAFFAGSTGIIYRQFSVTVASAMLLSVVVALILTPVLCASLMEPVTKGHEAAEGALPILRPFLLWFDRWFYKIRDYYVQLVAAVLNHKVRYIVLFLMMVLALGYLFMRLPTSYIPAEDQGTLLAQVILPAGSTLEQTEGVVDEIRRYFMEKEKEAVESCMYVVGAGFSGWEQNNGMVYIRLKDWHLRGRADLRVPAIAARATKTFAGSKKALIFFFPPRPCRNWEWPRV